MDSKSPGEEPAMSANFSDHIKVGVADWKQPFDDR